MSKSVLFTLLAFGSLNVFMLVSCNEEKTETTSTEAAAPVESAAAPAPAEATAAPASTGDSSMGSAETRPVDPAVKK
ncbi:MAG: hypothetical protein IPK62_13500 [Bacteroidetes bacterium]|nr:hypothetical protein [Bacteroidota bacterium]MBK8145917.1 hypothetical protein [Bacteroidota bacterium]MBP6314732.1 hypothetical protein [Chitinophagaceae bacterium]